MKKLICVLVGGVLLAACASYKNLYTLDSDYLERRNVETRIFDTSKTKDLLVASAQVLQDMGYTITESDVEIGVITATKTQNAMPKVGKVLVTVLSSLNGQQAVYDDTQKFYVCIVNTKANAKQTRTRVIFARIVYDNLGKISEVEKLDDVKLYTEFFDKLGQSVFLTANNI